MINNCILVGRLTKDIELRFTKENKAVGNFTLAVNRKYKDSKGNYPTDFIDCVIFGNGAETLSKYIHKGDLLGVEGSIQKKQYEDKEGNKHYATEIMIEKYTFLSQSKKSDSQKESEENQYEQMSIKVESESNIQYDESQLPF